MDLVCEYDKGVHRAAVENKGDDALLLTWIVRSVMPCPIECLGDVDVLAIDATRGAGIPFFPHPVIRWHCESNFVSVLVIYSAINQERSSRVNSTEKE